MPPNFLTGIRRKDKTTTLEEFKGKRAEKINRLRKGDRTKGVRRATIKGEVKKKGLSPSTRAAITQPRSPKRPKEKQPRKGRQVGFEGSPLSSTIERLPLQRKTLRRSSRRQSVLNTAVRDSQRLHSDIRDKGLSTLFLRSIMNASKMIPKGKEATSPSLELTPLLKNRIMKLRSSNKTMHSTSGPRGTRMNARRSTSTQMLEMRAPKKKMRNITNVLSAVRALRGSTLLHFKQAIRGAMTIGKKSFKNEPIRMRFEPR